MTKQLHCKIALSFTYIVYRAGINGMEGIAGEAGAVAPKAPIALLFKVEPNLPASNFLIPVVFFRCLEIIYPIANKAAATAIFFSMVPLAAGMCIGIPFSSKVTAS